MDTTDRSLLVTRTSDNDGRPLLVQLLRSPTIDDVLIGEGRLYLASLDREDSSITSTRVVSRGVRDYLIRLGVER